VTIHGPIDLSVVVPAYNEEERLPQTLRRFQEYFTEKSRSYEIIVVVDGHTNRTRDVLPNLQKEIAGLKVVGEPLNYGKGFSVRKGMLAARGRLRLFADADNSSDIAHFDQMELLFNQGLDVVIASRHPRDVAGATQTVAQSWSKRMLGQAGNLFVQAVAVPGIWDTQCGFKAFRGEAADRIFSQSRIDGWGFDIEVLALARALKLKVGIIPVSWVNDERSHLRWPDYFRVLGETVAVRYNFLRRRYSVQNEDPVATLKR
jgi:glycosyltransferase involved in cell wall biosynthesis